MANLKNTTADSVKTSKVLDSSSNLTIDLDNFELNGYYTRKIYNQTTSSTYTINSGRQSFELGPTFSNVSGFKPSSLIYIYYHIPTRNDNDPAWGGIYVEPQVRFNLGSWYSLGGTGFDLMFNDGRQIMSYNNQHIFDPQQTSGFSMQFRFYFSVYDNTTDINGSHDINSLRGNGSLMSGDNGRQHYMSLKVEELAKLKT